jgi:hypothetical protein
MSIEKTQRRRVPTSEPLCVSPRSLRLCVYSRVLPSINQTHLRQVVGRVTPCAPWSLDILPSTDEATPKAIAKIAPLNPQSRRDSITQPRVARRALPWVWASRALYPERVSSPCMPRPVGVGLMAVRGNRYNPFRVHPQRYLLPRVALGAQPWAEGCHPLRIERRGECPNSRARHSVCAVTAASQPTLGDLRSRGAHGVTRPTNADQNQEWGENPQNATESGTRIASLPNL